MDNLIAVDQQDNPVGSIEKMQAHKEGVLHRAFSVFLFTRDGQWLMQQRAQSKYHSGGRWSNTCCGHPVVGQDTLAAAQERLRFEMGLDCRLREVFSFVYKANLDHGMTEHEFDHVFFGTTDETPLVNPDEVAAWKYMDIGEIRDKAGMFTAWFNLVFERVHALHGREHQG